MIAVTVDNQHFYGITFSHQIDTEKQKRKNNDDIFHWFWFNSAELSLKIMKKPDKCVALFIEHKQL